MLKTGMSRTRYSDILVYPTYYHVTNIVGLTDSDCIFRMHKLFLNNVSGFLSSFIFIWWNMTLFVYIIILGNTLYVP